MTKWKLFLLNATMVFTLFHTQLAQADYLDYFQQGFNEKYTNGRPPCWNEAWGSFAVRLGSEFPLLGNNTPKEGVGCFGSGSNQSGNGAFFASPTVNVTTANKFSFWYASNIVDASCELKFKIGVINQDTHDTIYLQTDICPTQTWTFVEFNFPFNGRASIWIKTRPFTSSNRLLIDDLRSDININGDGSVNGTPYISLTQTICAGNTKSFTSSFGNYSLPLTIKWYLNDTLQQTGTSGNFSYANYKPNDFVYATIMGKSPCLSDTLNIIDSVAWYSNKTQVQDCKSDTVKITSVTPDSVCKGDNFTILFDTVNNLSTHIFSAEVSNLNSKTFAATPTVIGTGNSPITATSNDLLPGKYYIRIKSDKGVVSYNIDSIIVKAIPAISLAMPNIEACYGDSAIIVIQGTESDVRYRLLNNTNSNILSPWKNGNSGNLSIKTFTLSNLTIKAEAEKITNACKSTLTTTATITINPKPVATTVNRQTLINTDTVLNVEVTNYTGTLLYTWSPSDSIKVGDVNKKSPVTKPLNANNNFTVFIADTKGCKDTASMVVTVYGGVLTIPAGGVVADNSTICKNDTAFLHVYPSGGSGVFTFQWSDSTGAVVASSQHAKIVPATSRKYIVTVNDGFNTVKDSIFIKVNARPTVLATSFSKLIHTDTILGVTVSGGSGKYLYNWSPSASIKVGDVTKQHPATVKLNNNTTFQVVVTDSATNCATTTSLSVTVFGTVLVIAPDSIYSSQDTICNGDSVTLNVHPSGGSGSYQYTWSSNPVGFNASVQNPKVKPTTTTQYFINVTDGYNTLLDTLTIVVNPLPNINLTVNDTAFCKGDSAVLLLQQSQSGVKYRVVEKISKNIVSSPFNGTGNAVALKFYSDNSAQYNIEAVHTTSTCKATVNKDIQLTIHAVPVANGENYQIFINTDTVLNLSVAGGSGKYSFAWSPEDSIQPLERLIQKPRTTKIKGSGITFFATVIDSVTGCYDSAIFVIKTGGTPLVIQPQWVNINDSSVCAGEMVNIKSDVAGGSGSYSFSWHSVPSGFSAVGDSITVYPNISTWYIVTVNDGFNTVSDSVFITVDNVPMINFALDTIFNTYNQSVIIDGTVTGGSGVGTNEYWTPANIIYEKLPDGDARTYQMQSPTMIFARTVDVANGCESADSVYIYINDTPIDVIATVSSGLFNIIDKDTLICKYDSITIAAYTTGARGNYQWEWRDKATNLVVGTDSTIQVSTASFLNLEVKATDTVTISTDKDDIYIGTHNDVEAKASPDGWFVRGKAIQLSAQGGAFYEWSPADEIIDLPTQQNPTAMPTANTQFVVQVTDSNGCVGYDTADIKMQDYQVHVPEAFTPNGDGKNDQLRVRGMGIKSIDFKVFNRWGQLVFHTTEWNEALQQSGGWDGKLKESDQHMQTLGYILDIVDFNDEKNQIQGQVTIFK